MLYVVLNKDSFCFPLSEIICLKLDRRLFSICSSCSLSCISDCWIWLCDSLLSFDLPVSSFYSINCSFLYSFLLVGFLRPAYFCYLLDLSFSPNTSPISIFDSLDLDTSCFPFYICSTTFFLNYICSLVSLSGVGLLMPFWNYICSSYCFPSNICSIITSDNIICCCCISWFRECWIWLCGSYSFLSDWL